MASTLVFVESNNGAPGSMDRRTIRSHCMLSRNKKNDSRRSKREAAKKQLLQAAADSNRGAPWIPIPSKTPSDWALFPFAGELNKSAQKSMHTYFHRNPVKDPLLPFAHFGIPLDFGEDKQLCFNSLVADMMCFHANALLACAAEDLISKRPLSPTSRRHLQSTLPLLNDRLTIQGAHDDDFLLYVIGILSSVSLLFGDYEAVRTHSIGIAHIIRIRGGLGRGGLSSSIQLAIDRLNFSSSVMTEYWVPIVGIFADSSPPLSPSIPSSKSLRCLDGLVEQELSEPFRDWQHICLLLDTYLTRGNSVDGALVRDCVVYIQSSVLSLRGRLKGRLSICVHLAVTALFATTFRLPGLYNHPCSSFVASSLCDSLESLHDEDTPKDIVLWLAFVYLMSSERPQDLDRLLKNTNIVKRSCWPELRKGFKSIFWIDAFFDDIGQETHRRLVSCSGSL